MIQFTFQIDTEVRLDQTTKDWLAAVVSSEGKKVGNLEYIFCNDASLLEINVTYLFHDYYTDVITFDYTRGTKVSGDIFISLQRVEDNAHHLKTDPETELHRVMVHGLLHLCGYTDKTPQEEQLMREKEDFYLKERSKLL